jgi:hypothetical protein
VRQCTQQQIHFQFNNVELPKEYLKDDKSVSFEKFFDFRVKEIATANLQIIPLQAVQNKQGLSLAAKAVIKPTIPVDIPIQIECTSRTGGQWVFSTRLTVTPPAPDDTIVIHGTSSSPGSVAFVLKNSFGREIPYHAYFHQYSSEDIRVMPSKGCLIPDEQKTSAENRLVVTFAPKSGVRSATAMLIIETSEFSLFYEVRGVAPLKKGKV